MIDMYYHNFKAHCLNLQHWFITKYPGIVPARQLTSYIHINVIKLIWANTNQHIYIINQWVTAMFPPWGKGKQSLECLAGKCSNKKNTGKDAGWIIPTHFLNERWRHKLLGRFDPGQTACWILTPQSPFQGFWVIQTGYWPDFNLESFIFIKIYLFIKNLTEFHKMVETGVDPHLLYGDKIAMSVHLRYIVFVNCLP